VRLTFSTGLEAAGVPTVTSPADRTITVPDLSGMTGQQASDALGQAGVLDVEFAQNNAPLSNPVTDQSPPAGTQQRAGAPVGVTLAPPAAAAPAKPQQLTEVSPGTYQVGTGDGQVAPGKYKSTGPDGSNFAGCYYARLKNNDGGLGDIIANNISQGPSIMNVKASDGYVEVNGCTFAKS
jgi:beta-lactam-binding protein with PASTA domain